MKAESNFLTPKKTLWQILKMDFHKNYALHLMLLPPVILLFIYHYIPIVGLKIAFEQFIPSKGLFGNQRFVGMKWFNYLFKMDDFWNAMRNTIIIACWKMFGGMAVSIFFALLINEVRKPAIKRTVQTIVYLPHFISWIILSNIFVSILSPSSGIVNKLITALGGEPIFFLGSNDWFRFTMIITEIWKEFGFGTIIYLAAITSIDPSLYEAAIIDGANKFQQIIHVTLPGMASIIALQLFLNIGGVLGGNFDQIFNLYSPSVYRTGDILGTLVYRIGLVDYNFSLSTAAGVFTSLISTILVSISYFLAYKVADYRIF